MSEQIYTDVKTLLVQMSEKIGQGAEYGWEVVLKQQMVEGVISILLGIIGTIGFIWLLRFYLKANKEYWEFADFGCVAGLIFFFFFGGYNLEIGIEKLLNPAFYAIQFFVDLVK